MKTQMLTLRKAMKVLDNGEAWTIGTENGRGWIFYYDGKEIHDGVQDDVTIDSFYDRECVEVYDREERKHWSEADRRLNPYMELEAGKAFIVRGYECGMI